MQKKTFDKIQHPFIMKCLHYPFYWLTIIFLKIVIHLLLFFCGKAPGSKQKSISLIFHIEHFGIKMKMNPSMTVKIQATKSYKTNSEN